MFAPKLAVLMLAVALAGSASCASSNTPESQEPPREGVTESQAQEDTPGPTEVEEQTSASGATEMIEAVGPVAVVNGKEIPAERFNAQVSPMNGEFRRAGLPEPMLRQIADQILDGLIDAHLIERQIAVNSVWVSDAEVDAEFERLKAEFEGWDEDLDYQSFIEESGTTVSQKKADLRRHLSFMQLIDQKYDLSVDKDDIRAHYEQNTNHYRRPERIKLSEITIEVSRDADASEVASARKRAKELASKAAAPGADFARLARDHSDGPTAKDGGDLGYLPKVAMAAELARVAFAMDPGDVSEPVRTNDGFRIIRLDEHKQAGQASFDEVRDRIERELETRKFHQAAQTFSAEIKAEASIERKPENIKFNIEEGEQRQQR